MALFVYEGPEPAVSVGIAGATYRRGQVENVTDERQAAKLRTIPTFREVAEGELPAIPRRVAPSPDQGAPHPIPEVADAIRAAGRPAEGKAPAVGNINRDQQFVANTEALAGVEEQRQAAKSSRKGSAPKASEE